MRLPYVRAISFRLHEIEIRAEYWPIRVGHHELPAAILGIQFRRLISTADPRRLLLGRRERRGGPNQSIAFESESVQWHSPHEHLQTSAAGIPALR